MLDPKVSNSSNIKTNTEAPPSEHNAKQYLLLNKQQRQRNASQNA